MTDKTNIAKTFGIQVILAVVLTIILFYIDEGFYSFTWMTQPGNWVVFGLYVGIIVLFQWVLYLLIKQLYFGRFQLLISSFLGVVLGLILLFSML